MELKYNTLFQMLLKYLLKNRRFMAKDINTVLDLYDLVHYGYKCYLSYLREWGFYNMKATDLKSSKIMVSERGNAEDGFSKIDKKDIKIFGY
jgi:hypothetical protein